ncbi:MAG: DNA polymerase III subunit gamma/tau, partial [Candidatus Omnitrophota bacterium]
RILAKSLNCKNGPTIIPCQECISCQEITKGTSLDVIEIDGASNRGIDEIRTLRENVKFSPVHGKYKIYIIDEVHMLTTEAFNALLKTLEEPPAHVKFIFATTSPHKVIPTILSRCQRFDFRRIPNLLIVEQLEKICKAENVSIDKNVLFSIAKASSGSMRDAESILDQLVSFGQGKITNQDVTNALGIIEEDFLFEFTQNLINKDITSILSSIDLLIEQGKDVLGFITELIGYFRNLMLAKITKGKQEKFLDLPEDFCKKLYEQSQSFSQEELFFIFNTLVNAQEMSRRFDSWRIPLEIALVKLTQNKETNSSGNNNHKILEKLNIKKNHANSPEPQEDQAENNIQDSIVDFEKIKSIWPEFQEKVSKIKMSAGTYLSEGAPLSVEKNILNIAFPKGSGFHKEFLEKKENRQILEKTLKEIIGTNLKINFIITKEEKPHVIVEEDPMIKSTLGFFNAKIIKNI